MKCPQCQKEFVPQRKSARFCSSKCRLQSLRGKVSVSPVSVSSMLHGVKSDLSVSSPEEKKVSVSKQKDSVSQQARRMAAAQYVRRGYFGGKARIIGGKMSISYFDFQGAVNFYERQIQSKA